MSVHLAMFRYFTELGAKQVELVQLMNKFVPRNRIRVFRNERTRSTPLDPKLMCLVRFHSVWVHLSMFRYYMKLGAKRVELVQLMDKFAPLSRIGIFRNERTRSTPSDPKLKYWFVSYCLGAFWICFVIARNLVKTD